MFGYYVLGPQIPVELSRLYTTTNTPSQIYFEDWDPVYSRRGINIFGVDSTTARIERYRPSSQETPWNPYPPNLMPTTPPPYTQSNEPWYYTNCRLEDATEITICADPTLAHKPIIGMLIRYSDDSRSCVGSYRLDWARDRIAVDPSQKLRIGLGKTAIRLPYVAVINVRSPAMGNPDVFSWVEMPWSGRLEWWFSTRQCRFFHSD